MLFLEAAEARAVLHIQLCLHAWLHFGARMACMRTPPYEAATLTAALGAENGCSHSFVQRALTNTRHLTMAARVAITPM